jgi:hypothetical protein
MNLLSLTVAMAVLGATPESTAPDVPRVRQSAQRGLDFLAEQGVPWLKANECSGCHHMPTALWSSNEARRHGFRLDSEMEPDKLALRNTRPFFVKTVKQVSDGNQKDLGDPAHAKRLPWTAMVYAIFAVGSTEKLEPERGEQLEKMVRTWIEFQDADGSWPIKKWGGPTKAPIYDSHEANTLWSVLALAAAEKTKLDKDLVARSRERALAWLARTKPGDSHQVLALRLLVTTKYGKASEKEAYLKQMLAGQKTDGGWSWKKDQPSDALATGQALYALREAGLKPDDPVLHRARNYLLQKQDKKAGCWRLISGNVTYWTTTWATIALMRSLPEEPKPQTSRVEKPPVK